MKKNSAKNLTGLGLILLFGCQFATSAITAQESPNELMGLLILIGYAAGIVAYISGLCFYAKAKGHSAYFGLTGLLCVVGGIIVAFLKDKNAENSK